MDIANHHVSPTFDVTIIGGGLAGAALAGALANANLGVLLIEREATFRDRIRGEAIWPWGVAEIRALDLHETLMSTGATELRTLAALENRQVVRSFDWESDPQIGFSHPLLQNALFQRAFDLGAQPLRPAKATRVTRDGDRMLVDVALEGTTTMVRSRIVVMADGKTSPGRTWTGGESASDPIHHRFGGVLLSGMPVDEHTLFDATTPEVVSFWFAVGENRHRLYLALTDDQLRTTKADRSLEAFLHVISPYAPAGALDGVAQIGPLGFFPNPATWATRIAGDGLVLIGDAAGSADPTNGQGCSLVFRDVRELRDLLLTETEWNRAIQEFARRRAAYFAVIRAADLWYGAITMGTGREADARRERHQRAIENDPTLGGFRLIEERGPDGMIPDETARAHYFGDDLD